MRNRRTGGQGIYQGRAQGVVPAGVAINGAGWVNGESDGGRDIFNAAVAAGGIINKELAQEYRAGRVAELDGLVLDVKREFEQWKQAYNRQNQGRLGLNAGRDYAAKWDELARKAQAGFDAGDNEIFPRMLERKLFENGLFAVRDGGQWAERQRELWLTSQLEARMADFSSYAAANPGDEEGIAWQKKMALESWAETHPGQDPGAFVAALTENEFKSRMDSFMAANDLAGARNFLARSMAGPGPEASAGQWNRARNNPGNVTVDKNNFGVYRTADDGMKAIFGRFASYHKKGKKTPAAILSTYAPPSENDTAAYIANVEKWTGLKADREIDARDPAQLAALARGVLRQENSLDMSPEKLESLARDFLQEGEPEAIGKTPRDKKARRAMYGINPALGAQYAKRLEALEKADQTANWKLEADALIAEISDMPEDRREEAMFQKLVAMPVEKRELMSSLLRTGIRDRLNLDRFVAQRTDQEMLDKALDHYGDGSEEAKIALVMNMAGEIGDAKRRENLTQYGLSRVKHEKDRQIANDNLDASNFLQQNQSLAPAEFSRALENSAMSANARQRALDLRYGPAKEENLANMQASLDGHMLIDAGELAGREARLEYASLHKLTLAQTRQLMEYAGSGAVVSMSRANACLGQLLKSGDVESGGGISSDNTLSMRAYEILLQNLPNTGRAVTDQDIQNTLAMLLTSNNGLLWNRKNIMEQLIDGEIAPDWMPEVRDNERKQLEKLLQARGLRVTGHNLALLKKLNLFHSRGWQMPAGPGFDR